MQPTAQAVGIMRETEQAREGRKKLTPNVPFIKLDVVLLQKRDVLLLE
jgi:hypothetical protein